MTEFDMRSWALRGAEQRLVEIAEEASRIYAAFPELRDRQQQSSSGTAAESARPRGPRRGAAAAARATAQPRAAQAGTEPATARKRRRVNMSPEAKQRIAEAQRKRWAEWRARNAAAADGGARKGRASRKR